MSDPKACVRRPRFTRDHAFLVVIVMAIFAFSLWSSMWQPSGVAMIAWILGWGIGSGRIATRWPGFGWPVLCAVAMLLVWLPWTVRFGQTAWQSTYVFMFAALYLGASELGALCGNLLIRWRARGHAVAQG